MRKLRRRGEGADGAESLTAVLDPVTQHVVEFRLGVDLLGGRHEVVFDTPEGDRHFGVVDDHVAASVIVVAGLADAADIDQHLLAVEPVEVVAFVGSDEIALGGEDSREVGVPHEAIFLDAAKRSSIFAWW